jgi:hypothetical protein
MSTAVISSARPARVHKLAATQFDYDTVRASIRFDLQAQAKLIKKLIAKTTADLIDLGRHLIAAKQHIGHGLFIPWVEGEIGISGRTVQRYMAIAQLACAHRAHQIDAQPRSLCRGGHSAHPLPEEASMNAPMHTVPTTSQR